MPIMGKGGDGLAEGQLKIPQIFNATGSKNVGPVQYTDSAPVPWPPWSLVSVDIHPRRIIPTPVIPQRAKGETGKLQNTGSVTGNPSGTNGNVIDLRTTSNETTQSRSAPTIGETTIMTEEAQRIREIVYDVVKETFAPGRAAIKKNLTLPTKEFSSFEDLVKSGEKVGDEEVQSSKLIGTEVPRSTFGSPLSIDGASPSNPSVSTGAPQFATAAWKPKEPPCFFGRSTEDAHTWVSLVRNYLTFMSGSDSQQVDYTVTLFRDAAHEWYMSYERRNRGPPKDWARLVAALLDRFGSNIRSQEAQSQLKSHRGAVLCEIMQASLKPFWVAWILMMKGSCLISLFGDYSQTWLGL